MKRAFAEFAGSCQPGSKTTQGSDNPLLHYRPTMALKLDHFLPGE
jgi:hypothetical protein